MYALADCNNFFVSCERAFQPMLEGMPVVVLSNNDGCVVARSNESKRLGIKMGTPFFRLKPMVEVGRLIVRSSNYNLYGDMSSRVMSILASAAPKIEVYSIDEAYMILDGMDEDKALELCRGLVYKVRKWTGIPISIGIAPTKTLAKIANHFAKRYPAYKGVCRIITEAQRIKALSLTPVADVWGIGRKMAPKLERAGVKTAMDLASRPGVWVDGIMGIGGVRTWRELQGQEAIKDEGREHRQSICTSRSFAEMISDEQELSLRISDFAAMCSKKLRNEHSAAYCVSVFIRTNTFRNDLPQYYPEAAIRLPVAANSASEIVSAALKAFKLIYRPEYQYKRAGVVVYETVDAADIETTLFGYDEEYRIKNDRISALMDKFNTSENNLLRLASQRPGHYSEGIRREYCSPLFTTKWSELIEIKD